MPEDSYPRLLCYIFTVYGLGRFRASFFLAKVVQPVATPRTGTIPKEIWQQPSANKFGYSEKFLPEFLGLGPY